MTLPWEERVEGVKDQEKRFCRKIRVLNDNILADNALT
jgi:hypothetical protein